MNDLVNNKIQNITLDFLQVKRSYPDGMVPLIAEVARLKGKKIQFDVIPPQGAELQSLFEKNGWLHYLDPENWEKPTDVPLMQFCTDSELNDAVNKAIEVLQQQFGFAKGVLGTFKWALNEIATNVLKHSKASGGWIQVLNYPSNHQLALTICDSGVGIPVVNGV